MFFSIQVMKLIQVRNQQSFFRRAMKFNLLLVNVISGQFPWSVAFYRILNKTALGVESYKYFCGGALIHPRVTSEIHCFYNKD